MARNSIAKAYVRPIFNPLNFIKEFIEYPSL